MRRIVFVTGGSFPPTKKANGIATLNYSIVKHLHEKDIQLKVYVVRSKELPSPALPFVNVLYRESGSIADALRIFTILAKDLGKGDIVTVDPCWYIRLYLSFLKRVKGFKLVSIFGGKPFAELEHRYLKISKGFLINKIKYALLFHGMRFSIKSCDAVIVAGENVKADVALHGIKEEKIFVTPNGVDIEKFSSSVPKSKELLGYAKGRKIVMFYGVLDEWHGARKFVEILETLDRDYKGFIGVIVGSGPLRDEMERFVREKGLSGKVLFLGFVDEKRLLESISTADILLFPFQEMGGLPQVVLESMAMEKAVIATKVSSIADEIESGRNGFVHEKGDDAGIVETLKRLLEDDALRIKVGRNAREFVERNCDWRVRIENYIRVYRELGYVTGSSIS